MNGFLIIDKKAGMSSYDVIRQLKKLQTFNKIGYIGTLDRNATGILPVALNEGVKLIKLEHMLQEREPSYAEADIRIDTAGKKIEDIASEILAYLRRDGRNE